MKALIKKWVVRIFRFLRLDRVHYKNTILPPKYLRLCGKHFKQNSDFLVSSQNEATRLVQHLGLTSKSSVLDVGCSVGRLPIGILDQVGDIRLYCGIDVSKDAILWCQCYISSRHPNYQFIHIDVNNQLYNPKGKEIEIDFKLPFNDHEFDIIYLYSVFSHMTTEDVRSYLKEFRRILAPSGKIFLTAFIADGVPDISINPPDYSLKKWLFPLHCVRYNKDFFLTLLAENNFIVDQINYEKETDGQSALYISKK